MPEYWHKFAASSTRNCNVFVDGIEGVP